MNWKHQLYFFLAGLRLKCSGKTRKSLVAGLREELIQAGDRPFPPLSEAVAAYQSSVPDPERRKCEIRRRILFVAAVLVLAALFAMWIIRNNATSIIIYPPVEVQ